MPSFALVPAERAGTPRRAPNRGRDRAWRRELGPYSRPAGTDRHGAGVWLADADADASADGLPSALALALALALAPADAAADSDAAADPLGAGVVLGVGMGVGEGTMRLGKPANERAKISTKMTTTSATQIRARLSLRGGSEPR